MKNIIIEVSKLNLGFGEMRVGFGEIFAGSPCKMVSEAEPKDDSILIMKFLVTLQYGFHVGSPYSHKKSINPPAILEGDKLLRSKGHFDGIRWRRKFIQSHANSITGLLYFLDSGRRWVDKNISMCETIGIG